MSNPVLSTEDIKVYYGEKRAINGVSIDFDNSTITALIGPSGCGKSTYLRSLNLMNNEIPNARVEGPIWYHGEDINAKGVNVYEIRKSIGMVFQQPNPFRKSIRENITFGLKRHGLTDKAQLDSIVETSLIKAALWDEVKNKLDSNARALSGGQQQRLCIARTIAMQPDVILFDEPCAALDPISTAHIEDTLMELRNEYCIVIVTHNLGQAARVSDRTAFFMLGDLVEIGETAQIFNRPESQQLEDYITGRFG